MNLIIFRQIVSNIICWHLINSMVCLLNREYHLSRNNHVWPENQNIVIIYCINKVLLVSVNGVWLNKAYQWTWSFIERLYRSILFRVPFGILLLIVTAQGITLLACLYGLKQGRDVYRAIPAVIRNLGLNCLTRRTTLFGRLICTKSEVLRTYSKPKSTGIW